EAVNKYRLIKENIYLNELIKKQKEQLDAWSKELEYYVQIHTIDLTKKDKEIKALKERLKRKESETKGLLKEVIALRDKGLSAHSQRVGLIVTEMAKKLSLPPEEVELISMAGNLHDIGKVALSDLLLFKEPIELTKDEFRQYAAHSVIGQGFVNIVGDLKEVGILIRHHHENFDGSGFPDRLRGEKIPFGSKLIAIADRFERLSKFRDIDDTFKMMCPSFGKEFDSEFFITLESAVQELKNILFSSDDIIEAELSIKDLEPGFVVARDIIGMSGLMIVKKDTVLTDKTVELLKNTFNSIHNKKGIFVYKKRKGLS
ncbi:MAG: HD domain-containing protein, partial [Thermodesulfovibrionales bacterium]|nr:HD domain-containing protein [Thermodesulfovibrionales bacterium]